MSVRILILSRDALFARMLYNVAREYYTDVKLLSSDSALPSEKDGDVFLLEPDRLPAMRISELKQRKNTRFVLFSKTAVRLETAERVEGVFERPFPTALLREKLVKLGGGIADRSQTVRTGSDKGLVIRGNAFYFDGVPLALTGTEYSLLSRLYDSRGETVSKDELTSCLWNGDSPSNNLNVYISYLRKKLDDAFGVRLIKTVRGEGFRLEK